MSSVAPETIMRRHDRQSSNSIVVNSLPEGDERLFGVVGLTVAAIARRWRTDSLPRRRVALGTNDKVARVE
jgi:hypothetical protein